MRSQPQQELKSGLPDRQESKRPYHKPTLTLYGDIRTVSLGPSFSTDLESGGEYPTGQYP